MENTENKSESGWIKVLIFITALSIAGNIILFIKRHEAFPAKKELITENTRLVAQVYQYKSDLNKYRGISNKIDQVIKDANLQIETKEKQITQLSRDKKLKEKENLKLISEVDSIRELYLNVIDSLLVERSKQRVINNKIENLQEIIAEMNRKIGLASYLVSDNLNVITKKELNNGTKRPTAIAKKTSEIEICLDILENKICRSGVKDLYFLLTAPNGEMLVDGGGEPKKFYYSENKKEGECSKIGNITYNNKKLNYCITIKPEVSLQSGLYVIEIYTEENPLGMTTFSLK